VVANAIQKTVAIDRESSFGDQSAKDWSSLTANGYVVNVFDLKYSEVRQPKIPNKNLQQRAGATRAGILALRNGKFGFSRYLHGASANAAEAAQATRVANDELLYNALGGEHRGYAAGIAAGTASAPTVEDAHGDNLVAYGWSFFYDTSAGLGYFRQYSTVTEGVGSDTLAMVTGHTLPFTPDGGGADVAYAAVAHYPDWDALEDHTHANHTSLTGYFKGRHTEHSVEVKGACVSVNIASFEQGAPIELVFEGMCADFDGDGLSQAALTQTPDGSPGRVVGSGVATLFQIASIASDLATQTIWGQVEPTFGIEKEPVQGPNGLEGVHGYGITAGSYDATGFAVTVPFDDSWITAYRSETQYHAICQSGTAATNSTAVYFANLSFAEEPERVSVGGRDGLKLKFTALERDVAQGALTAAQWHRARAKFTVLRTG
jgi:hypothetical protein